MRSLIVILAITALLLGGHICAAESQSESLYELPISMSDQHGRVQSLDLYRGHAVLVALFYSNCPNACPLLIESLRATENALPSKVREDVRVLMISIDPERDTQATLAKLATTRRLDTRRWTIARVTDDDVRVLAAALGVQYRRLPSGEYNHTSVLTLLSPDGVRGGQTSKLGKADSAFVTQVAAIAQGRIPKPE